MNISPAIQKAFGRSLLQAQKHSPTILTAVGVVGVVTAGVLAARATLKLEKTLDEAQDRLDEAELDERSKTKAVVQNTFELVKLYGPSVTLGAASLVCIISAQGILHKRNIALVAGYKTLETAFTNYRERVVEAYGEDVDRDFRYGVRKEEIVDEKTGKKKQVVKVDQAAGEYVFSFGPENPNWSGITDQNEFFLTLQQNIWNDRLRAKGHVFLNEILDALALERTPAGAVTGWVYDEKNPVGDNFIDFGINNLEDFAGYILLDFNVDGTIFDKI